MSHCYDCQHSTRTKSGKSAVILCLFRNTETTAQGVCQSWESREVFEAGSVCNTRLLSHGGDFPAVEQW